MNIARQTMHRLPQQLLINLVRAYRFALSPWLGSACRFEPTCSAYALEALESHGALAGTYLTAHRLCRCHPLGSGGVDLVPSQAPTLFRHLAKGFERPAARPATAPLLPIDKTTP